MNHELHVFGRPGALFAAIFCKEQAKGFPLLPIAIGTLTQARCY